jgi:Secretion system C-terminal sorting domain
MKKLYLLLFTILITSLSFGQTTLAAQDFEGAGTWTFTDTPAAYSEASDTDIWTISTDVGSIGAAQSGSSFWGIRDIDNSGSGGAFDHTLAFPNVNVSIESDILITFYYYTDGYESSDYLRVEFFFDDVSQGQEELGKNTDAWTLYSKVVPNGTNNVRLTLIARQNGGTDYGGFDNILLQSDANVAPSLSITSPTEASTVYSGHAGIDAVLDIQNFTLSGDAGGGVSDNTGDGFINYTIDGGSDNSSFLGIINLTGLSPGALTLYVELVDNTGTALGTPVNATVNFTVVDIIGVLPGYEDFDYTVSETLGGQDAWTNNFSGDDVLIESGSLSYSTLSGSGNSIGFAGSGIDPSIDFTATSSGKIYASFMLKVTAMSGSATDGYFAILRDSDGDYEARIWISPIGPGFTTYNIGLGNNGGALDVTDAKVNALDETIFIVLSYDIDNDTISAWVNPTLGGSEPATVVTEPAIESGNTFTNFLIRQDSTNETPTIVMDELRGGTSWADVTPATLSNNEFEANTFKIYPNPTSLGFVNISSRSQTVMKVKVFDILGKQVINETITNNRLNVSSLNTGVYIMRVSQDNAFITKKLVIN